ncbi:MAG: DUF2157 domain-containing protein [Myxococcota bacterium]
MNSDSNDRRPPPRERLDQAAKLEPFAEMAEEGAFPADKLSRVESIVADSGWVGRWLSRALLLYGLSLVAVGVVFFFGFNWDEIPNLAKLGLVQIGFVGALVAGTLRDLHSVTARVLLVIAGVLIGVFFAVFGQVYQTSADAWELFAYWGALLLPLALLAGTQGAWVLFGAVSATAGWLGVEQAMGPDDIALRSLRQVLTVVGAAGAVLVVTEGLRQRGAGLVEEFPWSRPVLLVAGFGALTLRIVFYRPEGVEAGMLAATIAVLAVASALALRFYVRRVRDIAGPAVVAVSWLVIALRFIGEVVFDALDSSTISFLAMAIITLVLTAGLVRMLTDIHRQLEGEGEGA